MISPVKIWRRQKEIREKLGKVGKIIAWTKIFVTASDFKRYAPYPVVLVKLQNGEKLAVQMVDYEENDLQVGREVIITLRKVREGTNEGIIAYGLKCKPG